MADKNQAVTAVVREVVSLTLIVSLAVFMQRLSHHFFNDGTR